MNKATSPAPKEGKEYDEPLQAHSPEVLERLRKLLILKERTQSQGEAEAALAQAQKIAIKHKIDLAKIKVVDIDPISKEPFTTRVFKYGTKLYEPMHCRYVVWLLEEYFNVAVIWMTTTNLERLRNERVAVGTAREKKFELTGRHSDTEFATYAYNYLDNLFPKLWRKYKRKTGAQMTERRSFYYGVFQGLAVALKKAREEAQEESFAELPEAERKNVSDNYALMLVSEEEELKKAVAGNHPVLGTVKFKAGNIYDPVARSAGFQQGTKIKINRPLGDNKKSALG